MFKRYNGLLLALCCTLQVHSALANHFDPVKIGILAQQSKADTLARWKPLEAFLKEQIPSHDFIIKAYAHSGLSVAVASHQVEFVLTDPAHYIYLKEKYSLSSPLASMVKQNLGPPLSVFGGVIFSLASRSDINHLSDLANKRIAFTQKNSLDGYQIQNYALYRAGMSIDTDQAYITGMPYDKVVTAVLNAQADAGFIRSGTLEYLQVKQGLDLSQLKILNTKKIPNFPFKLSTRLYPEWLFAALPHVDQALTSHFTAALLSLHKNIACQTIGIKAFIVPIDYSPVEEVLRSLRAAPFEAPPHFTLHDIWQRYPTPLCIIFSLILLIIILSIYLLIFNRRLAQQRQVISKEAQTHHTLLAALAEGVYGVNSAGLCSFINPTALKILGYTEIELLGKNPHQIFHDHQFGQAPYMARQKCSVTKTLADGKTRHCEELYRHKTGKSFPVSINIAAIQISPTERGAVIAFKDISIDKQITDRSKMLVAALEAVQSSVMITDRLTSIQWVNPAFEKLTGYAYHEVVGQLPTELAKHNSALHDEIWNSILVGNSWRGEIINQRKDGSQYYEELSIEPVIDNMGKIQHFIAIKNDITERKRIEKHIQHLAQHDALTGLPNRTLLSDLLEKALHIAKRNKEHLALMFLDLDRFKPINDDYGHAVGDLLLKEVASRIKSCLRESDTVARIGGDEFIILLPMINDEPDALSVAEKIRYTLNQAFIYQGHILNISSSTGVAIYPEHGDNEITLAKNADIAMYHSKEQGRNNVQIFRKKMMEKSYALKK